MCVCVGGGGGGGVGAGVRSYVWLCDIGRVSDRYLKRTLCQFRRRFTILRSDRGVDVGFTTQQRKEQLIKTEPRYAVSSKIIFVVKHVYPDARRNRNVQTLVLFFRFRCLLLKIQMLRNR